MSSRRVSSSVAWAQLVVVTAGLLSVLFIFPVLDPNAYDWDDAPIITAFGFFIMAFSSVGALLLLRRPDNPIGWLFCGAAVSYMIGGFSGEYAHYSIHSSQHTLPGTTFAAWIGTWAYAFGAGLPGTISLLLFPSGRPLSPRWKPVVVMSALAIVLLPVSIAFRPGPIDGFPSITNPVGLVGGEKILGLVAGVTGAGIIISVIVSITSLIIRFRRATSHERQQLKWLAYSAIVIAIALLLSLFVESGPSPSEQAVEISNLIITAALATLPIAMGIAILRHRLYDIDSIISRTLVYATLTAFLALSYFALVVTLQSLLSGGLKESPLVVAASTLAAAALFRPARERVQRVIDRRFNRRKYNAAQTIDSFSARLRDELDLDSLEQHLLEVIAETMEPDRISIWLRSPTGFAVTPTRRPTA
jgi:hypothetical protein